MEPARRLPKLRGYIAEFLNEVSLTRLSIFYSPTCVGLRYGQPWEHPEVFLGSGFNGSALAEASTSAPSTFKRLVNPQGSQSSECAGPTATFNRRPTSTETSLPSLTTAGAGILNLLSIVYALRPRLRSRLTLGGRTFPRKPWVYGGQEFSLAYRYSCLPLAREAYPSRTDSRVTPCGIRSLIEFGTLVWALVHPVLYLRRSAHEASPQAISGRTSYHGV